MHFPLFGQIPDEKFARLFSIVEALVMLNVVTNLNSADTHEH